MDLVKPRTSPYRFMRDPKRDLDVVKYRIGLSGSRENITLCAKFRGSEVSLGLQLEPKRGSNSVLLAELGTCVIEKCRGEVTREKLLPFFSKLCIYAFLGVTHKEIEDLPTSKVELSLRLEISSDPRVYGQAFTKIFYSVCYCRLMKHYNGSIDLKDKWRESTVQVLKEIGPPAAESLMKSMVSQNIQIRSKGKLHAGVELLKLSYCSTLTNSCAIRCYCPRLEMKKELKYMDADADLEHALSHQLLQCEITVDSHVNIDGDCIHVALSIPNLKCKSLPVNSYKGIPKGLENEKYLTAKVSVTMGPERECRSSVHDLTLGTSSPNHSATVSKAETREFAVQMQVGVPPLVTFGLKNGHTITTNSERKNWRSGRTGNTTEGTLEFTLYENSGKEPVSVYDYKPCCKSHCKPFKALLHGVEAPFTPDGGINFEGAECGPPMRWRLRSDGNLNRKTLKWFVEVKIWLAYYPNKYDTHYVEIKSQTFRVPFEISLAQPVKSSPQ